MYSVSFGSGAWLCGIVASSLHVTNLTLTRRASFDSQPLISTGEMSLR